MRSGIPRKFSNYISWHLEKKREMINEIPYYVHKYFLNKDGISEVAEFYLFIQNPESIPNGTKLIRGIHISKYPEMYFFDKDDDNKIGNGEFLKDPRKNGLNGDEYWLQKNKYKK